MDFIFRGIGWFLGWLSSWSGHYLVGLLLFTILIEALILPFGIKQQKNSIRAAKIRPKEMAIRRKYKGRNDQVTQQKIAQEIQELYRQENFSPMAGCGTMLIQLPILLIIYQVVINPLQHIVGLSGTVVGHISTYLTGVSTTSQIKLMELIGRLGNMDAVHAEHARVFAELGEKAPDLTQMTADQINAMNSGIEGCFGNLPNTSVFGLNLAEIPSFTPAEPILWWLLLIPALTFIAYFVSTKLTRKFTYQANTTGADDRQMACSNTMMDWMMPIMSIFISFGVPAIVGIYWIYKSILGVVKQFILSKIMPLPAITEEDIKAAERELKGKNPAFEERPLSDGPVRSLHRIDEDDEEPYPTFVKKKSVYDELDEKPAASEEKTEEKTEVKAPAEDVNDGTKLNHAPLKDDERK